MGIAPARSRIHFVCPDTDAPSGGIRVIYRHVDHLVAGGIDAAVVHETTGFRPTWFDATATPVRYADHLDVVPGHDLLVIPEIYGPDLHLIGPGVAKVVFNQNAYNTFAGYATPLTHSAYTQPEVHAAVVVSEDNAAYLRYAFPQLDVRRTVNCVDPALFHPHDAKQRRLAWMPRKNADQARQVLNLLAARGALDGWEVTELDGLDERGVAEALRHTTVFLATGYPEGCPCPPKEAMAAGCVVVGYHGMGGRDYFTEQTGVPVPMGDIVAFAQAAERALQRPQDQLIADGARAAAIIAGRYSPQAERDSVLATWGDLLHTATAEDERAAA